MMTEPDEGDQHGVNNQFAVHGFHYLSP